MTSSDPSSSTTTPPVPTSQSIPTSASKKRPAIFSILAILSGILTFVEHKSIIGFMKTSVSWLETITEGKNASVPKGDVKHLQGIDTKLDLTTFGTNRIYYNFEKNNNTVGSGFILSDTAKSRIKNFKPQTITVNISFESGQKSFKVYIKDADNNSSDPIEFNKTSGSRLSSERTNERSYVISIKNLSKIDRSSISEIVVEGRQLKNSSQFFTLKNIMIE
jgi:hypothetical protein